MEALKAQLIEEAKRNVAAWRIGKVRKKLAKGLNIETIAGMLEEKEGTVREVVRLLEFYPDRSDMEFAELLESMAG